MRTAAGAGDRARWAASRTKAARLSRYFGGTDKSRVRHDRNEGRGPVSVFYEMVGDPLVDGPALLVGAQESLEARFLAQAEADVKVLRARVGHLSGTAVHTGYTKFVRALLDPDVAPSINDGARSLASSLVELAAIRSALGLEA